MRQLLPCHEKEAVWKAYVVQCFCADELWLIRQQDQKLLCFSKKNPFVNKSQSIIMPLHHKPTTSGDNLWFCDDCGMDLQASVSLFIRNGVVCLQVSLVLDLTGWCVSASKFEAN